MSKSVLAVLVKEVSVSQNSTKMETCMFQCSGCISVFTYSFISSVNFAFEITFILDGLDDMATNPIHQFLLRPSGISGDIYKCCYNAVQHFSFLDQAQRTGIRTCQT